MTFQQQLNQYYPWFGIIGPFISWTAIILALFSSPWFDWTTNSLSDLGISPASMLFSGGIICGGALSSIFAGAIIYYGKRKLVSIISGGFLAFTSISFMNVGIFTKHFGGITAVLNVSFELKEGEFLGIIGPNGSGKTTLVNLITGFVKPDSGRVTYLGKNITGKMPYRM